jgi:hypothetical protein
MTKGFKKMVLLKQALKQKIIKKVLKRMNQKTQDSNDMISEDESMSLKYQKDCVKEHYYTFQLNEELFTLLYTSYVFKWFQTDRVSFSHNI